MDGGVQRHSLAQIIGNAVTWTLGIIFLLVAWKELDEKSWLAAILIGAAGLVLFVPLKLDAGRLQSSLIKLALVAALFIGGMTQSKDWSDNASGVAHPLPLLDTTADVSCSPNHTGCTQQEFAGVIADLQKQWNLVPSWLRAVCSSKTTAGTLEDCITDETQVLVAANPNGCTPWLNPASSPTTCDAQINSEKSPYIALTQEERSGTPARARGMLASPGAIVCGNLRSVSTMYGRVADYVKDTIAATMTTQNGPGMERLRGRRPGMPFLDFAALGCTLVPAGTPLYKQQRTPVTIVAGELPGGKTFRGITFPDMVTSISQGGFRSSSPVSSSSSDPAGGSQAIETGQSASQTSAAHEPQGGAGSGIAPAVLAEMKNAERLNDICRDSSPEKPDAMATCDQRDALMQKLATEGWCWNPHSTTFAEAWPRCAP